MRKIFLALLLCTTLASQAWAEQSVTSGSVTKANIRLSIEPGKAFVDLSAANTLTNYLGYKLVVTDSAGKKLTGYIKAVGAGETYTANYVTNPTFDNDTGWNKHGTASISDGVLNLPAGSDSASQTLSGFTEVIGKLIHIGGDWTRTSGAGWLTHAANNYQTTPFTASFNIALGAGAQTFSVYQTTERATGTATEIQTSATGAGTLDNLVWRQVLTPSATGVTITSTSNGTTYDWASEDSGFNKNDTSNYTYAVYPGSYAVTISDNSTYSYQLVNCGNTAGQAGVNVTGEATLYNYTVVMCPAGGILADDNCTIKNTISTSSGSDIWVSSGNTVTGEYNLFFDNATIGSGTYTDGGSTTIWSTDPLFVAHPYISMWGDSLTENGAPYLGTVMQSASVYNGGVGGEDSGEIKTRMLAAGNVRHITVLWAGSNNGATDGATVKADIAEMVSSLESPQRYLVMGLDINAVNVDGSAEHDNIVQTNTELAALYPDNFIDIHSYLVSQYDPDIPQDVTDYGNDVVPSSLRIDGIHLNTAGYYLVANQIADFINTNYSSFFSAGLDFRLRADSPAINAGVDVGLASDYLGNAIRGLPDIGAYEYQLTGFPSFPTFPSFPGW